MFEDTQIKRYVKVHFLRECSTGRATADFRLHVQNSGRQEAR